MNVRHHGACALFGLSLGAAAAACGPTALGPLPAGPPPEYEPPRSYDPAGAGIDAPEGAAASAAPQATVAATSVPDAGLAVPSVPAPEATAP